ncbi:MAG: hypothetical protein WBE51_06985, partial [Xanthobacteraceae bacterium]
CRDHVYELTISALGECATKCMFRCDLRSVEQAWPGRLFVERVDISLTGAGVGLRLKDLSQEPCTVSTALEQVA